jgi:hypothetical protein
MSTGSAKPVATRALVTAVATVAMANSATATAQRINGSIRRGSLV